MTDGNYYMDGESFIRCKSHLIDCEGTPMIMAEEINFGHGLFYAEHICLVESACDRRMVPSSKEEFEIVKNLYLSCQQAIDNLNTGWFMPRWKEKENEKKEEQS